MPFVLLLSVRAVRPRPLRARLLLAVEHVCAAAGEEPGRERRQLGRGLVHLDDQFQGVQESQAEAVAAHVHVRAVQAGQEAKELGKEKTCTLV